MLSPDIQRIHKLCCIRDDIKNRFGESSLTRISIRHLEEAPSIPGVYFAHTFDSKILYIGLSIDLGRRLNLTTHHKLPYAERMGAKYLSIARVEPVYLDDIEKLLILDYDPFLNGQKQEGLGGRIDIEMGLPPAPPPCNVEVIRGRRAAMVRFAESSSKSDVGEKWVGS